MTIRNTVIQPAQRLCKYERDGGGGVIEADGPKKMENGIKGNKDGSLSA